jgi:hypothetical protein
MRRKGTHSIYHPSSNALSPPEREKQNLTLANQNKALNPGLDFSVARRDSRTNLGNSTLLCFLHEGFALKHLYTPSLLVDEGF